jgi:hypothetical protein
MVLVIASCSHREQQSEAESRTINEIFRLLPVFVAEHPGVRIISIEQLLTNHTRQVGDYPHQWHNRFKQFGKHGGFTNSVYEKYAFFPPGIHTSRIEGELLFINAKPFPGPRGEMERIVVAMAPDGFVRRSMSEETVQLLFREIEITEPKPIPMPPPPLAPPEMEPRESLLRKIEIHFFEFAENRGWNSRVSIPIWYMLLSLPVVVLALLSLWMWRHRRH